MPDDPTITRIRTSRHKISEHYHHNVAELIAHYAELEKQYQHRMVTPVPQDSRSHQSSEDRMPSEAMHEPLKPLAGNF